MIRKIKMALGGALAGMLGLFWLIIQKLKADKKQSNYERDVARSAKEAQDAANESARRVQEASHAQLQRNEEARQKRREQSPDDRFTGRVSFDRLRDKSDD